MSASRQQHFARGVTYGQRLLDLDPLLEQVHRELTRCYRDMGNWSAAQKQYAICTEQLRRALDIEPVDETQHLHQDLLISGTQVVSPEEKDRL